MNATTATKPKTARAKQPRLKQKIMKTRKTKSTKRAVVDPKLRKQMIEEAAYFKALNRDFQGDYCVEDWLEAETEVDEYLENDYDEHSVEDWQEPREDNEESIYCG